MTRIVAATTPGTAGWFQRIPTITATVAAPDTVQFRVRKSDHARWGNVEGEADVADVAVILSMVGPG